MFILEKLFLDIFWNTFLPGLFIMTDVQIPNCINIKPTMNPTIMLITLTFKKSLRDSARRGNIP